MPIGQWTMPERTDTECPQCGGSGETLCGQPECEAQGVPRPHLLAVPSDATATSPPDLEQPVRLIREYKTATVDELIRRADSGEVWLPGQMEAVEAAIQRGDLPSAGEILAVGFGAGGGSKRRWTRGRPAGWWIVAALTLGLVGLLWWTVGGNAD